MYPYFWSFRPLSIRRNTFRELIKKAALCWKFNKLLLTDWICFDAFKYRIRISFFWPSMCTHTRNWSPVFPLLSVLNKINSSTLRAIPQVHRRTIPCIHTAYVRLQVISSTYNTTLLLLNAFFSIFWEILVALLTIVVLLLGRCFWRDLSVGVAQVSWALLSTGVGIHNVLGPSFRTRVLVPCVPQAPLSISGTVAHGPGTPLSIAVWLACELRAQISAAVGIAPGVTVIPRAALSIGTRVSHVPGGRLSAGTTLFEPFLSAFYHVHCLGCAALPFGSPAVCLPAKTHLSGYTSHV